MVFKTAEEAARVFPKAHVIDVLGVCCVSPVCCLVFFFMILVLLLILYRKVPLCCKMRVYQESRTDMVRKIPFIQAFIKCLRSSVSPANLRLGNECRLIEFSFGTIEWEMIYIWLSLNTVWDIAEVSSETLEETCQTCFQILRYNWDINEIFLSNRTCNQILCRLMLDSFRANESIKCS